jgi:glycosyltransferase involved in cell wall biosynthesis
MRIVFNLLTTLKAKTGVGHYAARLFAALGDRLPAGSIHAFPTGRLAVAVRRVQLVRTGGALPANRRGRGVVSSLAKRALRGAFDSGLAIAFRAVCRGGRYDLYHEPNFIPVASKLPTVVTVHDLSVLTHPEWHPADRVRHHERLFRSGLASAQHIVTDSRFVRQQVIDLLGVSPDRVTAVPIGVGQEYFAAGTEIAATRKRLGLPPKYLLNVGTIEPRKNVLTLLKAYSDLPAAVRRDCPLVLAGGWGWKSADVAEFVRASAADKGVIHLGYTDDRDLPGLYAGARALAFPSFDEGFGLPPLEMLATGGAVLSSPAASLSEVLGGHAHFIDPLDLAGWRDGLLRAATDDDWLAEIRRGGQAHAAAFTWDRCAAATLAVYRSVLAPARRVAA